MLAIRCAAVVAAGLLWASAGSGGEVVRRGEPIPSGTRNVALASVIANPAGFAGEAFVTQGVVEKVCRLAGCWLSIAPAPGKAGMKVTFAGGFTVPRDSRGRDVRLVGRVALDEGRATLVASGVELTEAPE